MGKYYSTSQTTQEDKSIAISGNAEILTGSEAVTALPKAVVVGQSGTVGNITYNEFPEAVQGSIASLVGVVETSVLAGSEVAAMTVAEQLETTQYIADIFSQSQALQSQASLASQQALADKLQATELGTASIFPQVAKYILIAVVVIFGGKVLFNAKS